jgi:hypothetical protein
MGNPSLIYSKQKEILSRVKNRIYSYHDILSQHDNEYGWSSGEAQSGYINQLE